MRRLVLAVLAAVLLVAAPLAVSGFWADHALDDHAGYAGRMQDAWVRGGVESEFGAVVTGQAREQIQGSIGEGGLADLATGLATNVIGSGLGSQQFADAWMLWQQQLHQDLAAIVQGAPPRSVGVEGSILTVDISPLVSALLSGPIGGLALQVLGDDVLVQEIDTGYDLQGQLDSFATLWSSRWWAGAAAAAALAAWTALSRRRLRGAGFGLLLAAAGCLFAAGWQTVAAPAPSGDFPALTGAITDALLAGWSTWLLVGAALLGAAGALLVVVGRGSVRG